MGSLGKMYTFNKIIDNTLDCNVCLENFKTKLVQGINIDLHANSNPPSTYINIGPMPPTPNKGTYNIDATTYAVGLINNFLYKLTHIFNVMDITGFNKFTNKFYYYSKDKKSIGFTQLSIDEKTIIVCFRGSQTVYDFLADDKYNYYNINSSGIYPIQSKPETRLYTCPGFTEVYNEIKNSLLSNIASNKSLERIFICGHSLGASLSMLVANDLSLIYSNMVEVYGIAPPKTGDSIFSNQIQNNCKYTLSLINLADAVPSIITSYMYNKNKPNIPCSFAHIEPIAIFNNIQPSLQECHLIEAYYQGITNGAPNIINPVLVPVV